MLKKILFILLIVALCFSYNNIIYAKQIRKMNELTDNELIEYGRQLEQKEQEREAIQENANQKFEQAIQKEKRENIIKYSIVIIFIFLLVIILVLSILLHKKNKLLQK